MKIFVDTNVLVDTLVQRNDPAMSKSSAMFLSLKDNYPGFELCASTISLSTCFYFLEGKRDAVKRMRILTDNMRILDSVEEDFTNALDSRNEDLEDAFQYAIAKRHNCDIIITRDKTGFLKSPIRFMTPEDFLAELR